MPAVLAVKLLMEPLSELMLPVPEARLRAVAVIAPAVWPIAPEPLAVNVTVVPVALLPRLMAPLLAVVVSDSVPADVSADVVLKELSVDTARLVKVVTGEAILSAPAPLFTTERAPVVLRTRLGVEVLMLVILPEPEERESEVVPVRVPVV